MGAKRFKAQKSKCSFSSRRRACCSEEAHRCSTSNPVCNSYSSFSWSSKLTSPFNTAVCTLEKITSFIRKKISWSRSQKAACLLLTEYNNPNYNKITHTLYFGVCEDTTLFQRASTIWYSWKNKQQRFISTQGFSWLTIQDKSIAKAKAATDSFYTHNNPESVCTSSHFKGRKPFTVLLQTLT